MEILSALGLAFSVPPLEILTNILLATFIWCVTVVVYRLYFHPLAKIPGPLLAKATHAYSFYYNGVLGGRYYLKIEELHKQYGPVVRITPDEVHLSDPDNYDKIYYVGSKFPKSWAFYGAFGPDKAAFTTPGHEEHRVRRAVLNPFFSQKRVFELEQIVQDKAKKVQQRMNADLQKSGRIDLHHTFRAVSVDVITDYAFDNCYNFLDRADFGVEFFNMIRDFGPGFWFFQMFPFIQPIALGVPFWMAKIIGGPLMRMLMLQQSSREQILRVKKSIDSGRKPSRMTIFHQMLNPDSVSEKGYDVPTVAQLVDEAYILVAAAADTTGNALTVAAYNTVRNPDIYKRLTAELRAAFPDPNGEMDLSTLDRLPYLNGVIKEGIRLSFGVIGRLPRVVPDPGAEFNGYTVPAGSIVSMSSWIMHHNEDIFPDPEKFDPERWMDPDRAKSLDKYVISFGKGSRACVGMPLAYAELRITIGRIFRHFDNLTTQKKSREALLYDDFFSSYHPERYNKFWFEQTGKA